MCQCLCVPVCAHASVCVCHRTSLCGETSTSKLISVSFRHYGLGQDSDAAAFGTATAENYAKEVLVLEGLGVFVIHKLGNQQYKKCMPAGYREIFFPEHFMVRILSCAHNPLF